MPDICGHANCDKEAHSFTQVGRLIIMLCPEHADIRHEDWRAQRAIQTTRSVVQTGD